MAWGKAARNDLGFGLQYAALPWREGADGREILLITSRDTGRWIIPKGWPMRRREPWAAAEREALEEAGVRGVVDRTPAGSYSYLKGFSDHLVFRCEVQVFPLRVERELKRWPESAQRERRWFDAEAAARSVQEPELQVLLRAFAPAPA